MTIETTRFNAADYLTTPERIAAYLEAAFEEAENAGDVAIALRTVAQAKGMASLAGEIGLSREGLYKALSAEGNPTTDTLLKVFKAFGLRLSAVPANQVHEAA